MNHFAYKFKSRSLYHGRNTIIKRNPVQKIYYMFVPYDVLEQTKGTLATCFVNHKFDISTRYEIPEYCFILIQLPDYAVSAAMGQTEIVKSTMKFYSTLFCKFKPLTHEWQKMFIKNKLLTGR